MWNCFLAHKDFSIVNEDIEFLRSVEKNAFELVLNSEADENYKVDEEKIINDLKNLIEVTDKYGNGLLITDQEIGEVNILQATPEKVNNIHGYFDYILLNLNHSLIDVDNERTVKFILNIFSYLKVGGVIFIPKSTYDYVPGGRKGVEALVKNPGLNIEAPSFGIKDAVIASKTN